MVHLYIVISYIDIININQALEGFLVFRGYVYHRPRRLLNKRVLRGIRLCIRLLNSLGSYLTFTALLFGRRGYFLTAVVNMLWEIRHFWLGRSFEEFFIISTGVNMRP